MGEQLWSSSLTGVLWLLRRWCLRREVVAPLLVVALSASAWRQAPLEQAVLASQWLVLALGLARGGAIERLAWGCAALLSLVAWLLNLGAWGYSVVLSLLALPFAMGSALTERHSVRWPLMALAGAGLAPAALLVGLACLGPDNLRVMALEFESLWPTGTHDGARLGANLAAALVGFAVADRHWLSRRHLPRALAVLGVLGLIGLSLFRGRWFASMLRWPQETQWSEPPLLLNLLKLRLGAPVYGPLEDCNSYSYSPLLELMHHAVLSPWGLDLDLAANRALLVLWHALAVGLLGFALAPYTAKLTHAARAGSAIGILVIAIAVTSSLLAAVLHPDHILMVGFSIAILLVVAEARLQRVLFWLALLCTPILATMCKLTGAGLGLGLVLAFSRRGGQWQLRALGVLAVSGCLALSTIALFDATLGDFSLYAIQLQASHPIRWDEWTSAVSSGAGRAFVVAMLALGLGWLAYGEAFPDGGEVGGDCERRRALFDAGRLALLTLGFMVTSVIAYLKLGGRDNSLLPLTIGAVAILIRLLPLAGCYRSLFAPGVLAMLLFVAEQAEVPTAAARTLAERQLQGTVSFIERERASGRRTLYYNTSVPWLVANPAELPLDRWQTVSELVLADNPAQNAFWQRLRSGYYSSVVVQSHALDESWSRHATRFRDTLERHYSRVAPAEGTPLVHGTPMLFRYRATGPGIQ